MAGKRTNGTGTVYRDKARGGWVGQLIVEAPGIRGDRRRDGYALTRTLPAAERPVDARIKQLDVLLLIRRDDARRQAESQRARQNLFRGSEASVRTRIRHSDSSGSSSESGRPPVSRLWS
jgi:hypothetical protein